MPVCLPRLRGRPPAGLQVSRPVIGVTGRDRASHEAVSTVTTSSRRVGAWSQGSIIGRRRPSCASPGPRARKIALAVVDERRLATRRLARRPHNHCDGIPETESRQPGRASIEVIACRSWLVTAGLQQGARRLFLAAMILSPAGTSTAVSFGRPAVKIFLRPRSCHTSIIRPWTTSTL